VAPGRREHQPRTHAGVPARAGEGEGRADVAGAADRAAEPRPDWDEVAERYGDKIYTVAYRLTGNRDDAADLAQDVFVRVYRNLHKYEPGTFEGWLYRITKNLFLDQVRRRGRYRTEPLPDEEWRTPVSGDPGPADIVVRGTLEANLEEGLSALREDFRLAVVLCDVEGLSYEEIATVTGWPLGTVRSRIHRGRKQLRDHLEAVAGADEEERAGASIRRFRHG
jgi:RNA polymerase sigma-70 factor, ECF subfamily